MTRTRPTVVKFGGASLSTVPAVIHHVRELQTEGSPVVVVVSAREGVTDLLLKILGDPRAVQVHREIYEEIERRHPRLPEAGRAHLRSLPTLLARVERGRPGDLPLADRLLSLGERLAAHWVAGLFREASIPAVAVEADRLGLMTDNAYGASCILIDHSRPHVAATLRRMLRAHEVPVVTGFFGRSLEGRVAVLGRGGSDYSATAIGAILGATRVELVKKDVAVFSADPRHVPGARHLARLSYEEAEEMAQFGARVLHPLTIEPARQAGVEILVRSLEHPETATVISRSDPARPHRAVTLLRPLHLVRVRVPNGANRPGVVAAVSDELAHARINMVTLFTSSALLSIVLEPGHTRQAVEVLGSLSGDHAVIVEGPFPIALLTAIGDGIIEDLGRVPLAVLRSAQGFSASPRSLSLAVPLEAGKDALLDLHRALVESR